MHREFRGCSDISCSDVRAPLDTLFLVVEHAAHLPRLHPQQGCQRDTALLMVSLSLTQALLSAIPERQRSSEDCALG